VIKLGWIVGLMFAIAVFILYLVWHSFVYAVLVVTGLYLFYMLIRKVIREIKYRFLYVGKSSKEDKWSLDTNLADPPIHRP
jgi:hypothetical protein